MSPIVYRICALLGQILREVPVGTNLGLFHLLFALLSGRFLNARGAVFPALSDLGLSKEAVRRAEAALCYGRFSTKHLWAAWRTLVWEEGHFRAHVYEGVRPVACDVTAFFRPHLQGCANKHYTSVADKALPAVPLGLVGDVGSVGKTRLALPRLVLRAEPAETDAALQKRLVVQAAKTLQPGQALLVDAGFSLTDLLGVSGLCFVLRGQKNFTARRNALPAYSGKGRPCEYGDLVRPLARKRKGNSIPATPPDQTARWKVGKHWVRAHLYNNLVLRDQKPGTTSYRCVVIDDPRYKEPLVLVTNLAVTAYALWCLYHDRWPIEQLPLAAKQMLGAQRSFVFGQESRFRLPELALLAGNLLSYVAATSPPVATGFWDRAARPTCGRLRRALFGQNFSELALPSGQLRKKASVTGHLAKGVKGHRRQKAVEEPPKLPKAA